MAEDTSLHLPYDRYELITRILHAYLLSGTGPVTLDDVTARAGMAKSVVSRNARFLIDAGLLSEGQKKQLTEQGRRLAAAISNDLDEDIALEWRRSITNSPLLAAILDIVRVRGELASEELVRRIAANLGKSSTGGAQTGINTLIEIFQTSGLLVEDAGKLKLADASTPTEDDDNGPIKHQETGDVADTAGEAQLFNRVRPGEVENPLTGIPPLPNGAPTIPIHLNIELHLPASSEKAVYDALFQSIRENLLKPYENR